jgi:hypothetical protein
MTTKLRPFACDNEWCDGTMETYSVTCCLSLGRKGKCDTCGREVEHGWGGSRVLWPGRQRDGRLIT